MKLQVELIDISIAIGEHGVFVLAKNHFNGLVIEAAGYPVAIPPDLILD